MYGTWTWEMRRTVLYPVVDVLAKSWLAELVSGEAYVETAASAVPPGRSPAESVETHAPTQIFSVYEDFR